ncbi:MULTISPECIES: Gp37-like protein [Actinomadura]|uniref:Siphovirus ReqiPepy6 Gp37-like family protein n=1 Tax=Actinomadura yumaensis TaxID=111807 RepID=A0ABW2CW29_9ACTN|nr:siphovirus ReqiPepy6 Gp37-like family protein [Actinomadura sp. J1-007]MWK39566.1 hypothetical protein [Actinomadura sp. J1-007]
MSITLLVTDKDLNVVGDPIADWDSLKVTRTDNAPASGQLSLAARPEVMAQLQPGHRLVVIRDGQVWTAGPMEIPQEWQEGLGGADGGQDEPPPGGVEVNFSSDLAVIAGHLTYPNPALPASSASQPANYVRTGVGGEALLRDLVNLNAGPGALAARRVPRLVLGAPAGVGTATAVTTRFEPLGDVLRKVALAGGNLAFDTRQTSGPDGDQILFEVRARRDLTDTARFSFDLNNLRYVRYKLSAPTVTSAIVAGSGETSPPVVEVTDTGAETTWWRVEKYVSGPAETDADGELTAAGQQELAGGASPVELTTLTVDTDDLRAGYDFGIGDLVTVALPTGLEVADYVRTDTLTATPDDGESVVSVVGTPDATTDRRLVLLIRELSARLGRLETR